MHHPAFRAPLTRCWFCHLRPPSVHVAELSGNGAFAKGFREVSGMADQEQLPAIESEKVHGVGSQAYFGFAPVESIS
jgi:hypothetical protein